MKQNPDNSKPPELKGIERFCQAFSPTIFTYDITHKAATLLKRELESDERWKCFISNAATTREKIQQTPLAAIAPPNQRSKARYMNVDTLIISKLLEFVKMESLKARKDDRLLWNSEVIELVFGKMKRLEQNQAKRVEVNQIDKKQEQFCIG